MKPLALKIFILLLGTLCCCTACQEEIEHKCPQRIIGHYRINYYAPPSKIPVPYAVDAPMLGNGYTGVAISGKPEKQTYHFARNDFWRLKSSHNESFPAVLGTMDIIIPALQGASYLVQQHLYEAKTHSYFKRGQGTLHGVSYVSANEDLLIIELHYDGEDELEGTVTLKLPTEKEIIDSPPHSPAFPSVTQSGQEPEGIYYISRAFKEDVDIPTKAACAYTLLSHSSNTFKLSKKKSVIICVAFSSNFKSSNCLQTVIDRLHSITKEEIGLIDQRHRNWWATYWAQSYVNIHDTLIEKQYYLSNYNMGSFSRDKDFPPSIFGTCITKERPYWNGDYHLNYNHYAPYYGLFSSNHIEQGVPCNMPLLAAQSRGAYYSKKICKIEDGILLPVGAGPLGIETTRKNRYVEEYRSHWLKKGDMEDEGLFFGQKSNAAYGVVNMANHFYTTYEEKYTKLYYPFVKGVAAFWENYLKLEEGRYVIYNDAIHEGTIGTMNPILSLGLVRLVMQTAIDMSIELNRDKEKRKKWQDVRNHLSNYTYQERQGKKVFRYTEKGVPWWSGNTLGIQHIYPAGQIGLDSPRELLEVAHNTIDVMQRWIDFNGSNSFFPAAVRVGYAADTIITQLHRYIDSTYPNGFQRNNPHGIENLSTVPNTVNEMLCMGHGGILRLFPVWPKDRDASFYNLRKEGAFLVSSELKGGIVQYVELLSEKGKPCTLLNPWGKRKVLFKRQDGTQEVKQGERLTFETSPEERIVLRVAN